MQPIEIYDSNFYKFWAAAFEFVAFIFGPKGFSVTWKFGEVEIKRSSNSEI